MNKRKFWKYLTIIVSTGLIFTVLPQLVSFGLFIDAIGLDTFLLMFEVQFIAIATAIYFNRLKPALLWLGDRLEQIDPFFFIPSREQLKECPQLAAHSVPCLVWVLFMLFAHTSIYV